MGNMMSYIVRMIEIIVGKEVDQPSSLLPPSIEERFQFIVSMRLKE
jgi:hypothetical protein